MQRNILVSYEDDMKTQNLGMYILFTLFLKTILCYIFHTKHLLITNFFF